MRLALFGAPGVGKGTQAKLLVQRLGLTHISTGDLIRAAIRQDTSVGKQARSYVRGGQLVPGPIVRKLAEDTLAGVDNDYFILDGYPRTIEQAEWLTEYLDQHDAPLEAVLSVEVSDERIVSRLSKRRMNKETGEIYHLDFHPPPPHIKPEMLRQRKDDRPEAIQKRLDVYHNQTKPLEAYFEGKGLLHVIDGVGSIEVVYARIVSVLVAKVEAFGGRMVEQN
ncbi:MAG: adenylate kinase [Rhodothermales bacterium]|nr:adenylate kinase [Rhodothermales bacterium]